jgi:hypothetical protein
LEDSRLVRGLGPDTRVLWLGIYDREMMAAAASTRCTKGLAK